MLTSLFAGVLAMTIQGSEPASLAAKPSAVTVGSGTDAIYGTALTPTHPRAAALIIAGSGPTDRNGNNPQGVGARPYELLSEALAKYGIATLRYDKRGIAESRGAAKREEELRFETGVEDARTFAALLKIETRLPCVWLLGHSEGALVAQVAARDNKDVCGLVLMSGTGRPAAEILREQLTGPTVPEALRGPALAAVAELEAGRPVAAPPPELANLFRPSVQPYLMSWFRYDPAKLLIAERRPVLIVQGTTDLQTTLADSKRLHDAKPNAKLLLVPGMNHVLKQAPADRAANFATYAEPERPLAPGLVEKVAIFLTGARQTR